MNESQWDTAHVAFNSRKGDHHSISDKAHPVVRQFGGERSEPMD